MEFKNASRFGKHIPQLRYPNFLFLQSDYLSKRMKDLGSRLNSRDRLTNSKPDGHRDACAVSSPMYTNQDDWPWSPYEPPYIPPQDWAKRILPTLG